MRDPDAVPDASLAYLRCQQPPGVGDRRGARSSSCAASALLLVLDNCEHLLRRGRADSSKSMLGRARASQVLATSREGLDVAGERIMVGVRRSPCPSRRADLRAIAHATRCGSSWSGRRR